MNIEDLTEVIRPIIRDAIRDYFTDTNSEMAIFPLRTTKQIAKEFNVRPQTVRNWVKFGLLEANYQILSGRTSRLVFTNRSLIRFFVDNHPSVADLSMTDFHPKSSRAQRIQKQLAMKKLYARCRPPRATDEPR